MEFGSRSNQYDSRGVQLRERMEALGQVSAELMHDLALGLTALEARARVAASDAPNSSPWLWPPSVPFGVSPVVAPPGFCVVVFRSPILPSRSSGGLPVFGAGRSRKTRSRKEMEGK